MRYVLGPHSADRPPSCRKCFALMSADRVCQKILRIKGSILLSPAQCEITVPCARIARGSQQCDLPRTIDAANETGLMALR